MNGAGSLGQPSRAALKARLQPNAS